MDFYITYNFKPISQQMRIFIANDLKISNDYNWRTSNFTNNIVKCLGEDLLAFAKQDIEEFEKKINENQVEALRYWSTDKSSMSKEEKQELKNKKKELERETRKLSRIVEKLRIWELYQVQVVHHVGED